jgi:deoxycytidine triphosphate deaminase
MKEIKDLFPPNFDLSLLWKDPLTDDINVQAGAVLRAEVIRRYVEDFNLIIDQDHFSESALKGASYTMLPAPNDAWEVVKDGSLNSLKTGTDEGEQYYIVPKNSLVFIRLRQTLRMPFYLIARFNLKISYVYQGLLLGTGPQIDPGYTGRIYIPLHNLTNEPVHVFVNDTFVSFDFVRTTALQLEDGNPSTFQEFYHLYEKKKRPIDLKKLLERDTLQDYLGASKPYSSLGVLVTTLERLSGEMEKSKADLKDLSKEVKTDVSDFRKEVKGSKRFEVAVLFTAFVGLIAAVWGYYQFYHRDAMDIKNDVQTVRREFIEARSDAAKQKDFDSRLADIQREIQALRVKSEAAKTTIGDLQRATEVLRKQLDSTKVSPTALPRRGATP